MYVMCKWDQFVKDSKWRTYVFECYDKCEKNCDITYWLNICKPKQIDLIPDIETNKNYIFISWKQTIHGTS